MTYKHPREVERFETILMEGEKETLTPDRGQPLHFKKPGFICCEKCEGDFWPTGEEDRPKPILLCPRCRSREEKDARFFGAKGSDFTHLSDEELGLAGPFRSGSMWARERRRP